LIPEYKFSCLTYHAIDEGVSQYSVSESQLHAHLALLNAKAYVIDDFEQLEIRIGSGQALPRRYVVLTFDDGHISAMRAADVLAKHGCHATFFLTRDRCLKKSGYIREPQIRDLRRRGFSFGTHGTTHRKLTSMSVESCIDELKGSKKWLEDVIGENVRYTAAPGGYINTRIMRLTHEYGYILTGTCNEWMNSPNAINLPGRVNRVNIRRHFSLQTFRQIVEGCVSFYIWRQLRAVALTIPKQLLR
jgi:peptidoglycan/xylan/chitin deacetylase (PgdA/CDA1 family)